MYQAIHYVRQPNDVDAWKLYIRDDEEGIKEYPYYKNDVFKLDPEGEYVNLFDQPCSKVMGKYDKHDPSIFEKDIPKELGLLRDLYYDKQREPLFHNIVYLDMEIEIIGALTPKSIRAANAEITSMAISRINNGVPERVVWATDKSNNYKDFSKDEYKAVFCRSEHNLLSKFIKLWMEWDPTVVVHYNGDFFDIPYLYYRGKKIIGDNINKLSPILKINENPRNPQNPIQIGLVNSLDMMQLFKKFISKEEPSYKLDDIGEKYVNMNKIEYDGNLNKLFEDDIELFLDYNVRDIEILEKLEDKMGFVALAIQISHLCNTPYSSIYYNTVLNEGALLTRLKQKGIVAPNKPTTINPSLVKIEVGKTVKHQRGTPTIEGVVVDIDNENGIAYVETKSGLTRERELSTLNLLQGYNGGFLLQPIPGLYDWLSDFDYASFYPSTIRSLNIGIETMIGKIKIENQTYENWFSLKELEEKDPNDPITIQQLNYRTYKFREKTINVGRLVDFIKDNNLTITANGVLYRTDKQGIVSEILTEWFNLRIEFKNEMSKCFENNDMEKYAYYDRVQLAYKILLNAMYGAFSVNSFRFTDGYKMISSSITCSCQRLMQETLRYATEMIDRDYMN